jgi:hypothetical protein
MAIREPNVVVLTRATQYLSGCLLCVCAVATWRFNTGSHVKVQSEADVDRIVKQTQWATPIVVDELLALVEIRV